MTARKIFPVVLCGGTGSRLWPLSRAALPKQLLALVGEQTMLQTTISRLDGFGFENPLLICNNEQRFLVAEQVREVATPAAILLEPVARNTAAAVAVAALWIAARDPDALLLVLPSDHSVEPAGAFRAACVTAAELATDGHLVTFGITPSGPETGYGYIVGGEPLRPDGTAFAITRFVEKPDIQGAETLLHAGGCYWNSGMFMFSATKVLEELEHHAPGVLAAAREALDHGIADLDFFRLDADAFCRAPALSFDVAVMEKTSTAAVAPARFEWSDVGSWQSLWEVSEKDAKGNVLRGDVFTDGVSGSYIRAERRFVAVLGLEDVVVVETPDAVLVARHDMSQDVRKVVAFLEQHKRAEHQFHRRVYRPWGWYEEMDSGSRFMVKRIMVKPGAAISLQLHHHRAEHWVVVNGTARIRRGEEEFTLSENQSTYIPLGKVHRLENPGKIPLHIIEVQSGGYLAEDDIVRLDDRYGRGHTTQELSR